MGMNAIIAQSGGPTSVINATLAGTIEQAFSSFDIAGVYGSRHGIEGVIENDLINFKERIKSSFELKRLSFTPGAALGSCRYKLKDSVQDDSEYKKIAETFSKNNIGYFFYIGGNDSMDTIHKLSLYFKKINYPATLIGIPKTIDNDLMGTDHSPGYGSAAKYVSTTVDEIIKDCSSYSYKSATIIEVMGRDSGWLTAASQLGRITDGNFADLIYMPEVEFDLCEFIDDVKRKLDKKKHVVVGISEGVKVKNGQYFSADDNDVDNFGHKHLFGVARKLSYNIAKEIGCKNRSVELNVMQRCAAHIMSEVDYNEAFEIGREAVKFALAGETSKMAAFVREDSKQKYKSSIKSVDLNLVANQVKKVDLSHINTKNKSVSDELLNYIRPLTAGDVILQSKILKTNF